MGTPAARPPIAAENPMHDIYDSDIQRQIAAEVARKGAPLTPLTPFSAWTYTDETDPMTDRKTRFACTTSTNRVQLNPPYVDVTARLCLRQSPRHGLDVFVTLDGDGQIICRSYSDCAVKIRFGEGLVQSFSATDAADGSSNIVFITNAQRFVNGVQSADRTRIELTLYEAGVQPIEFNTSTLEWPRP